MGTGIELVNGLNAAGEGISDIIRGTQAAPVVGDVVATRRVG